MSTSTETSVFGTSSDVEKTEAQFTGEVADALAGASVTFTTPGSEPVTVSGEDFARAATRIPQQLSFDVGGVIRRPAEATLNITGKGEIRSQLFMDDDVTVQVIDAAGEIVAAFNGSVVNVSFVKHPATETADEFVERVHKIKLGDAA